MVEIFFCFLKMFILRSREREISHLLVYSAITQCGWDLAGHHRIQASHVFVSKPMICTITTGSG